MKNHETSNRSASGERATVETMTASTSPHATSPSPGEQGAEDFSAWAERVAGDAARAMSRAGLSAQIESLLHQARMRGYDEASEVARKAIRDCNAAAQKNSTEDDQQQARGK